MRLKILMTGDDMDHLKPEAEMLKGRGFLVYICDEEIVEDAVQEVRPDVVYINPKDPGLASTKVYHQLLDNIKYASIPVIYTLSEDDVYLVNRKRTASRDRRNIIADNIIDGIKTALVKDDTTKRSSNKRKRLPFGNNIQFPYYASRA